MLNKIDALLEQYIEGKDENRPDIHEKIYTEDAKLSFSVKHKTISFPAEIMGNKLIAKTLSADFNKKFDHVKTYYLSKPLEKNDPFIVAQQPWLVLMREKSSQSIMVGFGYYDWHFSETQTSTGSIEFKIKRHHIVIDNMLRLDSDALTTVLNLQAIFSYPWLPIDFARNRLNESLGIINF